MTKVMFISSMGGHLSELRQIDFEDYDYPEIYNLDLLSEKEWKELTMFSKKDLQTKTRQEIIDSILPVTKGKTFHCN